MLKYWWFHLERWGSRHERQQYVTILSSLDISVILVGDLSSRESLMNAYHDYETFRNAADSIWVAQEFKVIAGFRQSRADRIHPDWENNTIRSDIWIIRCVQSSSYTP
jgi:hypothetical protein